MRACPGAVVADVLGVPQVVLPEGSYSAGVNIPFELDYEGKEVGLGRQEGHKTVCMKQNETQNETQWGLQCFWFSRHDRTLAMVLLFCALTLCSSARTKNNSTLTMVFLF